MEKRYLNNATCIGAKLATSKAGNVMLVLDFLGVTGKDEQYNPITEKHTYFATFTEKNNDRNRELLRILGFTDLPKDVTPSAIRKGLSGKLNQTVDLVLTPDDNFGERIAFINEPRGVRIFDNTTK